MKFHISILSTALLIFIALASAPASAQTITIRKGETNYLVEATAPASNPHDLQMSSDMILWVDVRTNISSKISYEVNPAPGTRRFFRLVVPAGPVPPIRVLVIGDSMASDCCGWGRGLYGYFKPDATVVNYAYAWGSTKVFMQSAEYEKMVLIEPDYVLVQFGFIDGGGDPDRSTTLPEFAANLKTIVETIRGFGGVPILINLHAPRLWDEQGQMVPAPSFEQRNEVTRQVATEMQTPFIDLFALTKAAFSELGQEGTEFMRYAPGDSMHLNQAGGEYVSRLVVNALPRALAPYLQNTTAP